MKQYITINYKKQSVQCWGGALKPEDNIIVAYDSGNFCGYEDCIENWNYDTETQFSNWKDAVKYLIDTNQFGDIQQLERC